jgi:predicted nucleotidyltransferase
MPARVAPSKPALAPELRAALDALASQFGGFSAWLFGSEARGQARAGSDLDLALLFAGPVDPLALFEARLAAGAALGRDVDLVDLRRAGAALGMQVLRRGILVRDELPAERTRWAMTLPSRYEDLRIDRRPVERALLRRLARA